MLNENIGAGRLDGIRDLMIFYHTNKKKKKVNKPLFENVTKIYKINYIANTSFAGKIPYFLWILME